MNNLLKGGHGVRRHREGKETRDTERERERDKARERERERERERKRKREIEREKMAIAIFTKNVVKEEAIRTERVMDEQRGRGQRDDKIRNRDRESAGKERGGIIKVRRRGRHREGQTKKLATKLR